ncbi:MAG: hypothetical protein E6L00_03425 [Thaumarchaeota archaeon]|nr:MAG: hypothetical protein E6L00_03425 [Nitrososphaerota archaeon]
MATLRYLWIVETRAGLWQHWISKGKKGPMPDADGFLHLNKKLYAVDPRKFRRWTLRMGLIIKRKRQYQVQIWKENDPNPIDFLHVKIPDPKFTSSMISTMAKSRRLNKIISGEQFDIVKLALILSLLMNIGIVIWLASQVIHQ